MPDRRSPRTMRASPQLSDTRVLAEFSLSSPRRAIGGSVAAGCGAVRRRICHHREIYRRRELSDGRGHDIRTGRARRREHRHCQWICGRGSDRHGLRVAAAFGNRGGNEWRGARIATCRERAGGTGQYTPSRCRVCSSIILVECHLSIVCVRDAGAETSCGGYRRHRRARPRGCTTRYYQSLVVRRSDALPCRQAIARTAAAT